MKQKFLLFKEPYLILKTRHTSKEKKQIIIQLAKDHDGTIPIDGNPSGLLIDCEVKMLVIMEVIFYFYHCYQICYPAAICYQCILLLNLYKR